VLSVSLSSRTGQAVSPSLAALLRRPSRLVLLVLSGDEPSAGSRAAGRSEDFGAAEWDVSVVVRRAVTPGQRLDAVEAQLAAERFDLLVAEIDHFGQTAFGPVASTSAALAAVAARGTSVLFRSPRVSVPDAGSIQPKCWTTRWRCECDYDLRVPEPLVARIRGRHFGRAAQRQSLCSPPRAGPPAAVPRRRAERRKRGRPRRERR